MVTRYRHKKALAPKRIANLKREAEQLGRHASQCAVEAVRCQERDDVAGYVANTDGLRRVQGRIADLMAIPAVRS